jgi:hypothetical protein
MQEHDGPTSIQLREYLIERGIVERLAEHRAAHADAHGARESEPALELCKRCVNVRQRQADEGQKTSWMLRVQIDVQVVRAFRGSDRDIRRGVVGRRVAQRNDRCVDAGRIHQLEMAVDRDMVREPAHLAAQPSPRRACHTVQQVVQRRRVVVRVNV